MNRLFGRFLRDESGAATVDSIVVLGGLTWMLVALAIDVGVATVALGDRIGHEMEYNQVLNDIVTGYGPNSPKARARDAGG